MKINRISPLTGIETTLDLPITQEQLGLWQNGMVIQNAMPNLSADEREFIKTGYTSEDWKKMFPGNKS